MQAEPAPLPGWRAPLPGRYAARAVAVAIEAGFDTEEVEAILAGRPPTDVVPPRFGETPEAYAERATGELMVLYVRAVF